MCKTCLTCEKSIETKRHKISTLSKQSIWQTPNWLCVRTFPTQTLSQQSVHLATPPPQPPRKQEDITAPLCAHGDLTVMMMSLQVQRVGQTSASCHYFA